MIVRFPPNPSIANIFGFYNAMQEGTEAGVVDIDFKYAHWIEPFQLLLAQSEIIRFRTEFPEVTLRCMNYEHLTYPAHMGFFWGFGLPFGNRPGQASGNNDYIPINLLWRSEIEKESIEKEIEEAEVVEHQAIRLSQILCRADEGELFETISYSMREVMRNVIEHSETDRLGYCAQYWPTKHKVEVCVSDWGIGIYRGLSLNPDLKIESNLHALNLALMPGISGKGAIVKKLKSHQKTAWTNSGYGLYMTSRLCRNGGKFLIGSGNKCLLISGSEVLELPWQGNGTLIRLVINTKSITTLSEMLAKFRREANEFKRQHKDHDFLTASMASRKLISDFKDK